MRNFLAKIFCLMLGFGLMCVTPAVADDGVTTLGTAVGLTHKKGGNSSTNQRRSPAYIPTLLSISGHTLYAYPGNVGGAQMTVTVLDGNDEAVAVYTVSGTDIVPLSLPADLAGDYDVEVEVGDNVYVGVISL